MRVVVHSSGLSLQTHSAVYVVLSCFPSGWSGQASIKNVPRPFKRGRRVFSSLSGRSRIPPLPVCVTELSENLWRAPCQCVVLGENVRIHGFLNWKMDICDIKMADFHDYVSVSF